MHQSNQPLENSKNTANSTIHKAVIKNSTIHIGNNTIQPL